MIKVGSGNCGCLVSCDRIQSLHLFSLLFPSSKARQREIQHPSTSPLSPFCLSSTSSSSREPCLRCFFSRAAAPEHSNPRHSLHSDSNSGGPWQLPAPSVFSASPEEIGDRFIPPIYRFCCLFRSAPGLISPIFGDRFIPIRSRFDFLLRFSRARDLRRRSAAPPASLLSASPAPARDLHPLHQRRRSARVCWADLFLSDFSSF